MSRLITALVLTAGILSGYGSCSKATDDADTDQSAGRVRIAVPLPRPAEQGVEQVTCVITAPEMPTVQAQMSLGMDDMVRGTVEAVVPGTGRVVTLNAYDSAGELAYTGWATTDIVAGQMTTLAVSVVMGLSSVAEEFSASLPGGESMEFVWIDPGAFTMGASDIASPTHEVRISRGFYLARHEITQGQWEAVMEGNPSHYLGADRPVERVSWDDVQEFIARLNAEAGQSTYRLPSEAEWEYACRAGTSTRWSFGDDSSLLGDHAWYQGNNSPDGTKNVGGKQPNPWGLYDMHGNVWEWVQDWYGPYSDSVQTDPTGPTAGAFRVYRGGDFYFFPRLLRSAFRYGLPSDAPYVYLGARLVRTRGYTLPAASSQILWYAPD